MLLGVVCGVTGCTAESRLPSTPPEVPVGPGTGFARAAFLADVNLRQGRIVITAPTLTISAVALRDGETDLSLVGGDVVLLTTSNFAASAVGAFQPGKVRVTFDISMTSRLDHVALSAPTVFPAPPPGAAGPLLFPYDIAVATTSGGITTGGQGNDIIVVQPSLGLVAPSTDWNGAPWSFFNDQTCPGDDCYRYEEFAPIAPLGTSLVQRVGFDLDPTVGQFTARLIVAADLQDTGPAVTGSIQGSVSSPTLGPISGVTVTAQPGDQTAITDATGGFLLSGVPVGMTSLTFSGLPTTCAALPSYVATVNAATITAFPLVLTCSTPSFIGTLQGTVTRSDNGPASGVILSVTPNGGLPEPSVATNAVGEYVVVSVEVSDGTGAMLLSNLPASCQDPGPITYSGLITGGTLIQDIVLVCGP
jgi:hypothetical protein